MLYTYGINNKAFQLSTTGKLLGSGPDNPLNLPPFTIRLKYKDGVTPSFPKGTKTRVSTTPNVWDLTYTNTDWSNLLEAHQIEEVIGANSFGVTDMSNMFYRCTSLTTVAMFDTSSVTTMEGMFQLCYKLTSVPLFDTSNVTDMSRMFYSCDIIQTIPTLDTSNVVNMEDMCGYCKELTVVPLFNTSKVTNMSYAFEICYKVQTGALALYQQASTQTNPPTNHYQTFAACGRDTTTGAAELAKIGRGWK